MFYLGMAYSIGDGVAQNDDYALRWIRAAADRQLTMAQHLGHEISDRRRGEELGIRCKVA